MEVEHFSHPDHPLILINQVLEYVGEHVICSGCEEPISGTCYSCTSCYFFLHKKCAELPGEIRRPLHPQHPLLLLAKPPYYGRCLCDLCDKTCESFVYHCSLCEFDLDIKCAFPPCIFEVEGEGHNFIRLIKSLPLKSFSFTCNACGTEGDDTPYMCTTCQLMVHRDCTSLQQTLKIRQHPHLLTFTYFFQEDESGKPHCGVCQIQFKSGRGGYNCKDCNFFAHVNCTRGYQVIGSDTCIGTNDESMDSSTCNSQQIERFSHQHSLILMGEFNNNMKCEGCMLPISNPFYGCPQCNFCLHKACGELPRQLQLEDETLTLLPRADTVDGIFCCCFCHQYCHGFTYTGYGIGFDVRCGVNASKGTITHESHKHPLFLSLKNEVPGCSACNDGCTLYLFRCAICDFNLDHRCATLPREARHEFDEHPLFLTYTDPNDYQFFCDICENERDPKLWFYRCEECRFDAHPECVLGKNPYIKLGGSYIYDFHPHPLALVEKKEEYPPCHSCGEPCDDLALECTHSQCSFIIHRKKRLCFHTLLLKQ